MSLCYYWGGGYCLRSVENEDTTDFNGIVHVRPKIDQNSPNYKVSGTRRKRSDLRRQRAEAAFD